MTYIREHKKISSKADCGAIRIGKNKVEGVTRWANGVVILTEAQKLNKTK